MRDTSVALAGDGTRWTNIDNSNMGMSDGTAVRSNVVNLGSSLQDTCIVTISAWNNYGWYAISFAARLF